MYFVYLKPLVSGDHTAETVTDTNKSCVIDIASFIRNGDIYFEPFEVLIQRDSENQNYVRYVKNVSPCQFGFTTIFPRVTNM